MLKNKIIVKKIRNIFILLMALIIMMGAYHNIRNSKAENVIQVELEITDKSEVLSAQTIIVDATETSDGNYLLNLPVSINKNIVTKYYTSGGEEIAVDLENNIAIMQLTDEEIENKKVEIQTDYDTKEVTINGETELLYKKELTNEPIEEANSENTQNETTTQNEETTKNGENTTNETIEEQNVIVTGYMPLDAKAEIKEIDLAELTKVKIPNENQTMQRAYEVSIYQMVEKTVDVSTDATGNENETQAEDLDNTVAEKSTETDEKTSNIENTTTDENSENEKLDIKETTENIEMERVEYNPSVYGEKLEIKTKFDQTNVIATIYSLDENNKVTEIESKTTENNDEISFETEKEDKTISYIIATEEKSEDENKEGNLENSIGNLEVVSEEGEIDKADTEGVLIPEGDSCKLLETNTETTKTSGFLGNTSIQRQNIENVTFKDDVDELGYGVRRVYSAINNTGDGHDSSVTTWTDLYGIKTGELNGGTWKAKYLQLDGVDDWVNFGVIDFKTGKYTLDVIMSLDEIKDGEQCILDNFQNGGLGLRLVNGIPKFTVYITELGYVNVTAKSSITVGKKTRLTGTFNEYTNKLALYVDGELQEEKTVSGSYGEPEKSTRMALGTNPSNDQSTKSFTKMKVYSVKMHNYDLSAAEIAKSIEIHGQIWDVSVAQDKSIRAWTKDLSTPATVYISGIKGMYANEDSSYLFAYIGSSDICQATETITNLNLLDVSAATNMSNMFRSCGYVSMESLDLGDRFITYNVTDMSYMFWRTGFNSMTSLSLGSKFEVGNVTNMNNMFNYTGYKAMTSLDLGPAFTKIANSNTDMFTNCGKSGAVIKVPESIYKNRTSFKLSSTDTSTSAGSIAVSSGRTIEPKYRPEWQVEDTTINTSNKTLTVKLKGTTNEENYTSTVTSSLSTNNISVFIDGTELTAVSKAVVKDSGDANLYNVTLGNFEETAFQTGKNYKEWSGNISLKIDGRAEATSTYSTNILVDEFGNQSMSAIDTSGIWVDIQIKDNTTSSANTSGKLFADFINPTFIYEYANTTIDHDSKKVTVVFDVIDKYFGTSSLATDTTASQIGVKFEGVTATNANKTLTKISDITDSVDGVADTKVGERYQLVVTNLDQGNGGDYSGIMTLAFDSGIITDKSGNSSIAKTITIGVDEPTVPSDLPDMPTGFTHVAGTDLTNGYTIQDSTGNQYVWVEVPQTTAVYSTAGLNVTEFTSEEYTKIENDLHTYTSVYREDGYTDTWSSEDAQGLTESAYNELKQKMLKSVYQNGGFYVGKYETGTETARTDEDDALTTAVIKPNMIPYNYVTNKQAQTLASGMETGEYTSSLMFGVQWDLVLKHFENKGATQAELNSDSTNWGNYKDSLWNITNANAKYTTDAGSVAWRSEAYGEKNSSRNILLSTGASETFNKMGIYDMAGNLEEWTLENSGYSGNPSVARGGEYTTSSPAGLDYASACFRSPLGEYGGGQMGFRIALYKEPDSESSSGAGSSNDPTIVDVVDPIWKTENVNIDKTNKKVTLDLIATDKYLTSVANSTLTTNDITIKVDGDANANNAITKSLSTPTFSTNTTTGMKEIKYTLTISNWEESVRQSGKSFLEYSGNTTITIAAGTVKDDTTGIAGTVSDGVQNSSKETTFDLGQVDFIKPEFTYEYANTVIDHNSKKVTVVFDVTDKYFNTSALTTDANASKITVKFEGSVATNATKTLTKLSDITATVNGTSKKVGERYQLVVTNLDQGNGGDYSGIMTLNFPAGVVTDTSSNQSIAKTITIGVDEPTAGDQVIVDVVDPIWKTENVNIDKTNKKVTLDLIATDKYLTSVANSTLTTNDITVKVDGDANANNAITKSLSTPTFTTNSSTGLKEIKYTLTLDNWEESAKQTGKSFLEYSGNTTITIAAGTVKDDTTGIAGTVSDGVQNSSKETTFDLGHVDFIKPRIEKVSSTTDASAKTETIVFNVIDKYLDTSTSTIDTSKITTYVDGETANLTKQLTRVTAGDSTATVNGSTQVVSQQYKLVLSGFEGTINGKNYKDWSGTVSISIQDGVLKDKEKTSTVTTSYGNTETTTSGGNTNDVTSITGDFVDFINPELKYVHQSSDISTTGKTYTMSFTITDKYYKSGKIGIDDLTIKMQNGQLDSSGNEIIYNLKDEESIGIAFRDEEIKATNVAITNSSGNIETVSELLIGHTYTLTLSQLEQFEAKTGHTTADYSGIVTVAVAGNKVTDKGLNGNGTSGNGNIATTITSGVNIPGGTSPDNAQVVDVVDPIWKKVSSSVNIERQESGRTTATVTFNGTDTYFANNTLEVGMIKVFIDGTDVTSSVTKTLSTATVLTEQRKEFGKTTVVTKQYGVQYTLEISGIPQCESNVKIQIPAGVLTDESGNSNKITDLTVYSTLINAETENTATSAFLGNTSIQRQNIENVTFEDNIPNTVYNTITNEFTNSTAWDVSAAQDKSIIAWYEVSNSNGAIKVHISSNGDVIANKNSSCLFAYIGYSNKCTATEAITNIDILNVYGVTNMSKMFEGTGYRSMTVLDLGNYFDVSSVTNMDNMFNNCGTLAMTTLDLGPMFTKIVSTNFMDNCGTSNLVIYAPESVYSNNLEFYVQEDDGL